MTKHILLILSLLFCLNSYSQVYTSDTTYPLSTDGSKRVITGFTTIGDNTDKMLYAKAFLWAVDNICPQLHDGMTEINHKNNTFAFATEVESMAGSSLKNTYQCNVKITIIEGKLVFYVSNIIVKGSGLLKKVTPLESYKLETNAKHAEIGNDFVRSISFMLNKMFSCIDDMNVKPITHWDEIINRKAVKGMTMDECRIAFGKPQIEKDENKEVQWMYTSNFYIFFSNGVVKSIIK